jgi:hypothetical protein
VDDRYGKIEFAYASSLTTSKEQLIKIPAGSILFPAEGEGRNAIYAATQGWNVMLLIKVSRVKESKH